jgi:hypothetical protein
VSCVSILLSFSLCFYVFFNYKVINPCQNDPSEKVSARSASLNGEVSA